MMMMMKCKTLQLLLYFMHNWWFLMAGFCMDYFIKQYGMEQKNKCTIEAFIKLICIWYNNKIVVMSLNTMCFNQGVNLMLYRLYLHSS